MKYTAKERRTVRIKQTSFFYEENCRNLVL